MLNICMTADHELFTGVNFVNEEEVLLEPTEQLLKILEAHDIPLTLFTDVCSIARYRQLVPDSTFPDLIEAQLRRALSNGHDVQLHIHPHWMDTEFVDGNWVARYERFRLHLWGFDKGTCPNAQSIIHFGKTYLESLLKPLNPSYDCISFRAGGWCLQPEEPLLKALISEGIWIDTTVFRGGYMPYVEKWFDYRNAPDVASWWIEPALGISVQSKPSSHAMFEVSIGSDSDFSSMFFKKLKYRNDRKRNKKMDIISRGTTMDAFIESPSNTLTKVVELFTKPIMLSFDNACASLMIDIIERYVRLDAKSLEDTYVSVIGHPKTIGFDDLKEIDKFCKEAKRRFGSQIRFITMRDIGNHKGWIHAAKDSL